MRAFDADVSLVCGGTLHKCQRCQTNGGSVIVQLPWPGEVPTEKRLCKVCIAEIVEEFFSR